MDEKKKEKIIRIIPLGIRELLYVGLSISGISYGNYSTMLIAIVCAYFDYKNFFAHVENELIYGGIREIIDDFAKINENSKTK